MDLDPLDAVRQLRSASADGYWYRLCGPSLPFLSSNRAFGSFSMESSNAGFRPANASARRSLKRSIDAFDPFVRMSVASRSVRVR